MPVIINDFEIITESPRQEPAAAVPPAADEQPPALRPEDIARIMARQATRTERVRAD